MRCERVVESRNELIGTLVATVAYKNSVISRLSQKLGRYKFEYIQTQQQEKTQRPRKGGKINRRATITCFVRNRSHNNLR